MKSFKYLLSLIFILAMAVSCKKEVNDDISFVASGAAPEALSVLFQITQDNSGLVTITPNGAGAIFYDVFFGDGTAASVKVDAGKNITHTYAEGVYTVKLIAHSVNGKTTEYTKQLTVSFRAPANLIVTVAIDPVNNFKVNVSATALYETFFRVY